MNALPRPSATWVGHSNCPSFQAKDVDEFIASLGFDSLCRRVNAIRNRNDCSIKRDKYSRGQDNIVFELGFGDGMVWVVRMPLRVQFELSGRKIDDLESEIITMKYVSEHCDLPIPRIHGYDLAWNNDVGAPYMLMDGVRGEFIMQILPMVHDSIKPHVYRQVARALVQLSQIP